MRFQTRAFGTGSQAGFTLLELLVVLAIAALVASLFAITFPGSIGRMRAKTAAHRLVMDLRTLRHAAIAGGQSRSMTVMPDGRGYALGGIGERLLPAGVTLRREPSEGAAALVFMPDGSASGPSLVIGGAPPCCRVDIDRLTGKVVFRE